MSLPIYLIGINNLGYAVVNTETTARDMLSTGHWVRGSYADFHHATMTFETASAHFCIRADGRFAIAWSPESLATLIAQDFYEVEREQYDMFVRRYSAGVSRRRPAFPLKDQEEQDDTADS